jgi:hypothetical protein
MMSEPKQSEPTVKSTTGRDAYNVVSDLAVGVNVRRRDNLYQGLAILVCLILGCVIGAVAVRERVPGALVGGFIGLVVGLFGSGIFLMVYRFVRHVRGLHD